MPDAELLPAWAQVSDDDLDLASLLESSAAPTHVQCRPVGVPEHRTATYDESALPENDLANPKTSWRSRDLANGPSEAFGWGGLAVEGFCRRIDSPRAKSLARSSNEVQLEEVPRATIAQWSERVDRTRYPRPRRRP